MNETTSIDLLTVEEFAERLKISRSTVFGWLKAGLLQEGKHYFRIGRIIRFVWDAGLLLGNRRIRKTTKVCKSTRPTGERLHSISSEPGINLDYG